MTTLRDQVSEFHAAMGQPILPAPVVPDDARVRLRAALIAEEFFETLEAMFGLTGDLARDRVDYIIKNLPLRVDLPALADGLADLDYVIEGTRLEFGIDGAPIAAEVHRANMSKAGGLRSPRGKVLKPVGFVPPDVFGELKRQGWEP